MERASALLRPRPLAAAAVLAALVLYYALHDLLPRPTLLGAFLLVSLGLVPAVFSLVWLALPLRASRGTLALAVAFALLAVVWSRAGLEFPASFAKFAAAAFLAWWFLSYFEDLSWAVLIAGMIAVVDSLSVWRGPTRHIVTEQPQVFGALSFPFPVPGGGSFDLGLPDVLFFSLFLGATARWGLRLGWTWLAMVASFAATMALALWVDPFGIGGLPALPGISLGFLLPNADLLWRHLRRVGLRGSVSAVPEAGAPEEDAERGERGADAEHDEEAEPPQVARRPAPVLDREPQRPEDERHGDDPPAADDDAEAEEERRDRDDHSG